MVQKTTYCLFATLVFYTTSVNSVEVDVTFDSIELTSHPKGDGYAEKMVTNNGFITGSRMSNLGESARTLMSSMKLKEIDLLKLEQLFEIIMKKRISKLETPEQKETGFFAITIWPVKGDVIIQYAIGDAPFEITEFEKIRDIVTSYDVGGW